MLSERLDERLNIVKLYAKRSVFTPPACECSHSKSSKRILSRYHQTLCVYVPTTRFNQSPPDVWSDRYHANLYFPENFPERRCCRMKIFKFSKSYGRCILCFQRVTNWCRRMRTRELALRLEHRDGTMTWLLVRDAQTVRLLGCSKPNSAHLGKAQWLIT